MPGTVVIVGWKGFPYAQLGTGPRRARIEVLVVEHEALTQGTPCLRLIVLLSQCASDCAAASLFLYLTVLLFDYASISLSLYLTVLLFDYASISLCFYLAVLLFDYASISLCSYLTIPLSHCASISLCFCLTVLLSYYASISLCFYLTIPLSHCASTLEQLEKLVNDFLWLRKERTCPSMLEGGDDRVWPIAMLSHFVMW